MSPSTRGKWLAEIPWELVEYQNAALCEAKSALHRPTSEGWIPAKDLWDSKHKEDLTLPEVVELCRECHRLAPFCNYNGNTFAAIVRTLISKVDRPGAEVVASRSLAGHIVAGVASDDEIRAFAEWCKNPE